MSMRWNYVWMCVRRRVANESTATCAEHALVNGVCAVM